MTHAGLIWFIGLPSTEQQRYHDYNTRDHATTEAVRILDTKTDILRDFKEHLHKPMHGQLSCNGFLNA